MAVNFFLWSDFDFFNVSNDRVKKCENMKYWEPKIKPILELRAIYELLDGMLYYVLGYFFILNYIDNEREKLKTFLNII